jgi:branched-chain amino acid transport system substrate-binding protein
MRFKSLTIIATVGLFLFGLLVTPALADLKIGAVFSVTGRASFLGDPEKKTAEMIAEQVNAAGGINGEKLELIVYDDEGDATKCNLAFQKLITQDKVCVIIGPSLSGLSLAVIPLAEKHRIPNISCAASYKIVYNEKTGKPYRWVFKVPQSDSMFTTKKQASPTAGFSRCPSRTACALKPFTPT